jgi:hypothetical protein
MLPFGDFLPKKKETSTQHNWQMIFLKFFTLLVYCDPNGYRSFYTYKA